MSEAIERVARALAPISWAAFGTGDTLAHENRRKASLRHAKAAIRALSEPTGEMEQAYLAACDESGACLWKHAYRTMMRAALGE